MTNSGFIIISLPQINRIQDKLISKTITKMNKNTTTRRQKNGVDFLLNKEVKTDFVFKQNVFEQIPFLIVFKTGFKAAFVTISCSKAYEATYNKELILEATSLFLSNNKKTFCISKS